MNTFVNYIIGPAFDGDLTSYLKSHYFSLIFDETTDCTSTKLCALTIIFFDNVSGTVKRAFFDIYEGDIRSDCITLKKEILSSLQRKDIPPNQIIALSTDTTNVMAGETHSLYTQLKKDIPRLLTIKCTCHLINLCAEKSCLKLPRNLEDLPRDAAAHFSRSHLRQKEFERVQEGFDDVLHHKMLKRAETRWLSRQMCVNRIIEQFKPLKEYFESIEKSDYLRTTSQIVTTLQNPYTMIYLHFMSYTLSLLNDINTLF